MPPPRTVYYSCFLSMLIVSAGRVPAQPAPVASAPAAVHESRSPRAFRIPAADASDALMAFSAQAGTALVYVVEQVRGIRTNRVEGRFLPREALDQLVANTTLSVVEDDRTGALMIKRGPRAKLVTDVGAPPLTNPDAILPKNAEAPRTSGSASSAEKTPLVSDGHVPKRMKKHPLALFAAWLGLALSPVTVSRAADAGMAGTVEGRVFHVSSGSYVNNARVRVEPASEITFTNESGEYRLSQVPAGPATVTVTYAGLPEERSAVTVIAGQTLRLDFKLFSPKAAESGDAVVLGAFVVGASREMEARAIALNEQRFAANIRNVVSTDEFGDLGNSDVGDFIKFLPGVTVTAGMVSVRGLPPQTVPLTVDGNRVASQFPEDSRLRASALDSVSLGNVARIEVFKSPTPDSPADSLGGAVNLVSKRAFERATPLFRYHAYLTGTTEYLTSGRVPGPSPETSGRRVGPGFDFTYIAPINDKFGFTLTGVAFNQLESSHQYRQDWVPNGLGRLGATATNPYMARFELNNRETYRSRASFGTTVDWKISPGNTLTVGAQYTFTKMAQVGNSNIGDVSGQTAALVPTSYGPGFTQGVAGAATQQYAGASRIVPITTILLSANYRHDGPVWRFETGGSFSKSTGRFRDIDYGFFQNSTFRMERATIRYDEIQRDHPEQIIVRNSAGSTVAPYTLGEYRILTATSSPKNELDYIFGGKAHASRRFNFAAPVTVKTGLDWHEQIRDMRSAAPRWDFVGPDRVAGTPDDLAGHYDLLDTNYYSGAGVAGIKTAQWPDRYKLYQLFQQHPEYFQYNETGTLQASTANSRKIIENVSAAYLRLDSRMLNDRILLVGGVRFEHTNDYGEGQLNDLRATYQQDANGRLILDAAGRPVRVSTDAVVRARLQYKERGAKAERSYDDFFPSLNATWNLRDNLIARAAYAKTFGRPDFQSIVPTLAVADPASADRTITASDPGLKPWTGQNYDLSLEYYFQRGGLVSVGAFRKDISNFFGQTRTAATADRLADIGLTEEFLNYDIVSNVNVGDARVDGIEIDFRQELTFLPRWARGLEIHANATRLELAGANTADFTSFVPRSYNWGVSLTRSRFNVTLNWHKRGRQQGGLFTGNDVAANTFQYTAPSQQLDLNFVWRMGKRLSLYGVIRNVTGSDAIQRSGEIYSAQTPEYARLRIRREAPTALNFGLKGEF